MFEKLEESQLMKLGFASGLVQLFLFLLFFWVTPTRPAYQIHSSLHSTVMGLQLSRSENDIYMILGNPGDAFLEQNVENYLKNLDIDYTFIFFYSLFFIAMFESAFRMGDNSKWIRVIYYLLCVSTIVLDLSENFMMHQLLSYGLKQLNQDLVNQLFYFSYSKWILVYVQFFIIGSLVWIGSRFYFMKLGSIPLILPAFLCLFSYHRLYLIEAGFVISLPGLILFWIYFIAKVFRRSVTQT